MYVLDRPPLPALIDHRPAEMAQLQWYLHEVINEVFSLFDVDSDGTIEPGKLRCVAVME